MKRVLSSIILAVAFLLPVSSWAVVSDDFNGATNGQNLSAYNANWSVFNPTNHNQFQIQLNTIARGNGSSGNRYSGRTWADDQYSQGTIAEVSVDRQGVMVRAATTDVRTYYGCGIFPNQTGHSRYLIWKVVAGTFTSLAVHGSTTMAINDIVRCEISGFALTLILNGSTLLGPTTDGGSSIASGQAGIIGNSAGGNAAFTDWEGDDLAGGPSVTGFLKRRLQ
jgi:hypothetical protein